MKFFHITKKDKPAQILMLVLSLIALALGFLILLGILNVNPDSLIKQEILLVLLLLFGFIGIILSVYGLIKIARISSDE